MVSFDGTVYDKSYSNQLHALFKSGQVENRRSGITTQCWGYNNVVGVQHIDRVIRGDVQIYKAN
jgi:hypothetical protein